MTNQTSKERQGTIQSPNKESMDIRFKIRAEIIEKKIISAEGEFLSTPPDFYSENLGITATLFDVKTEKEYYVTIAEDRFSFSKNYEGVMELFEL